MKTKSFLIYMFLSLSLVALWMAIDYRFQILLFKSETMNPSTQQISYHEGVMTEISVKSRSLDVGKISLD